jgi:hypothetical protein
MDLYTISLPGLVPGIDNSSERVSSFVLKLLDPSLIRIDQYQDVFETFDIYCLPLVTHF